MDLLVRYLNRNRLIVLMGIALAVAGICLVAYLYPLLTPGSYDSAWEGHVTSVELEGQVSHDAPQWIEVHYALLSFWLMAAGLLSACGLFVAGRLRSLWDLRAFGLAAVLPGLCRFNNNNVLDHETRNVIYAHACKYPGSTRPQIARDLGMNEGTVGYHLDTLVKASSLRAEKMRKCVHYFSRNHSWDRAEMQLYMYLRNDVGRAFLLSIRERPGVTGMELSRLLGRNKSTVSWHMDRLEKDCVITVRKEGRNKYATISGRAEPVLARLMAEIREAEAQAPACIACPRPAPA